VLKNEKKLGKGERISKGIIKGKHESQNNFTDTNSDSLSRVSE
jgi:hypothetical protein